MIHDFSPKVNARDRYTDLHISSGYDFSLSKKKRRKKDRFEADFDVRLLVVWN